MLTSERPHKAWPSTVQSRPAAVIAPLGGATLGRYDRIMLRAARSIAKQLAFTTLANPPLVTRKLRAIRQANALTILNLHRVAPPDGSTYPPLSPRLFEYLLRFVRRHFDPVTFAELDNPPASDRPRLILSFDDGYADFATFAAPLLEKYGIRANQNIIAECVETGLPPLGVIMQDYVGKAPVDELHRLEVPGFEASPASMPRQVFGTRLGAFIMQQPAATQSRLAEALLPQVRRLKGFAPTPMLTLDQVRELSARHEIGAHSFAHASLGLESDDYVRDDVARCKQWFAANLDQPVTVYAFPNGSFRPGQIQIVRDSGIERVLLVEEDFSDSTMAVHKRFNFDAVSRAEVRFRATGGLRRPRRPS